MERFLELLQIVKLQKNKGEQRGAISISKTFRHPPCLKGDSFFFFCGYTLRVSPCDQVRYAHTSNLKFPSTSPAQNSPSVGVSSNFRIVSSSRASQEVTESSSFKSPGGIGGHSVINTGWGVCTRTNELKMHSSDKTERHLLGSVNSPASKHRWSPEMTSRSKPVSGP